MEPINYYLITPLAYTGAAKAFTYHSDVPLKPAQIVQIPIGRRIVLGIVDAKVEKPTFNTKPISSTLDLPPVPSDLHLLAGWVADYYAASPSSIWNTILPTGLLKTRRPGKPHKPKTASGLPSSPLAAEQSAALTHIQTSGKSNFLLQGVTGSGKTRVYLELAARTVAEGRSVIILVPEITLTPQIVAQFETIFGDLVLASHSKLTEAERHRIWTLASDAAAAGRPTIIIGPRSCLFMPTHKLGLIVVDECHESSYKQDQHPRYHAVAVAARRAKITGAILVLGSATPGLGELYLAGVGRIEHIFMNQRANKITPPRAKIIDLRNKELFTLSKFITQPLYEAIADTMTSGRQTLLYLNRRGSASSQVCGDCGHVTTCPNCALPLTFHADLMKLICHHCNFRITSAAVCPECHGANLKLLGGGTKRIEAEIERLFPEARLARLDRDSATLSHIKEVFAGLKARTIDILIGTQMIAKGLDLPAIDTVGIVSADTMLHLPDFSAAERTYQLLSQVSGRAGRGDRAGQVFIQTYTPDHPAIQAAATGAYAEFAAAELLEREALGYPPYTYLLKLTAAAPTSDGARQLALTAAADLRRQPGIRVAGPAPAFIELGAGKYHWIVTVTAKQRNILQAIASDLPAEHWTADLDPINLL